MAVGGGFRRAERRGGGAPFPADEHDDGYGDGQQDGGEHDPDAPRIPEARLKVGVRGLRFHQRGEGRRFRNGRGGSLEGGGCWHGWRRSKQRRTPYLIENATLPPGHADPFNALARRIPLSACRRTRKRLRVLPEIPGSQPFFRFSGADQGFRQEGADDGFLGFRKNNCCLCLFYEKT